MSYPVDELDRRAERLNERLKYVLLLYLAGELSAALAKALGDELLLEAYIDLVVYVRRRFDSPHGYNSENQRIKKVLEKIRQDFYDVVDKKGEQTSDEELKRRTWFVALGFMYMLYAESVIEVAIITGVRFLRYNTAEDPKVCLTCKALKGVYSIHEPLPQIPIHVSCRCWWTLIE